MQNEIQEGPLAGIVDGGRWLTVTQASDMLQVHPETVREWLRAGRIPGTLISRRAGWRILRRDIEQFLSGPLTLDASDQEDTALSVAHDSVPKPESEIQGMFKQRHADEDAVTIDSYTSRDHITASGELNTIVSSTLLREIEASIKRMESQIDILMQRIGAISDALVTHQSPVVASDDSWRDRDVERFPGIPRVRLTERELEVLRLGGAGLSSREIANKLFISLNTVDTHLKSLYRKLGVHTRFEAIASARSLGMI